MKIFFVAKTRFMFKMKNKIYTFDKFSLKMFWKRSIIYIFGHKKKKSDKLRVSFEKYKFDFPVLFGKKKLIVPSFVLICNSVWQTIKSKGKLSQCRVFFSIWVNDLFIYFLNLFTHKENTTFKLMFSRLLFFKYHKTFKIPFQIVI